MSVCECGVEDENSFTIFLVGAKGGSLGLRCECASSGSPRFVVVNDSMGSEEIAGRHFHSERVKSIDAAFARLDEMRTADWLRLFPIMVHPAYGAIVWRAFEERAARRPPMRAAHVARWREVCLAIAQGR